MVEPENLVLKQLAALREEMQAGFASLHAELAELKDTVQSLARADVAIRRDLRDVKDRVVILAGGLWRRPAAASLAACRSVRFGLLSIGKSSIAAGLDRSAVTDRVNARAASRAGALGGAGSPYFSASMSIASSSRLSAVRCVSVTMWRSFPLLDRDKGFFSCTGEGRVTIFPQNRYDGMTTKCYPVIDGVNCQPAAHGKVVALWLKKLAAMNG